MVAGCGTSSSHVIDWKPLLPPREAPPPLAPPCRADDLRVSGPPEQWNGAGGDLTGGIAVTNTTGHPCALVGRPLARFTGSITTKVTSIPSYGDDPLNRPPLSSLRALAPGHAAWLMVIWHQSWCGTPPAALLVTLPASRSTLRMRNDSGPRCNDPTVPTTQAWLSVSHWTPFPGGYKAHLPLRAELVGPTYRQGKGREVRYYIPTGHILEYEVALVNTSRKPFRFHRCPLYREEVTRQFVFMLNCRPAGTIPPGGRAVFEMRIPNPLKTGGGLSWDLPQVDADTFVDAPVIVGPPPTRR